MNTHHLPLVLMLALWHLCTGTSSAQLLSKGSYIPSNFRTPSTAEGRQFSLSNTAASDNFFMIWGDSVGSNPQAHQDPNLRFDPKQILDTMEYIYKFCRDNNIAYEKNIGFEKSGSNAAKYKYVVIMYNTFGQDGPTGWSDGGAVDDTIGAVWLHPSATRNGHNMAHEYAHALQAMFHIDNHNRSRGTEKIFGNAPQFYDTHANYIRNIIYPSSVTAEIDAHHTYMLEPDWKTGHSNYPFLMFHWPYYTASVNNLWTQWRPGEYPLQTRRRLSNKTQASFNWEMHSISRKAATLNFPMWFRELQASREALLRGDSSRIYAQRTFDVLRALDTTQRRFYTDAYNAPQDYGCNVVPLYIEDSTKPVIVEVIGHPEVNDHAGWIASLSATDVTGTVVDGATEVVAPRVRLYLMTLPSFRRLYLVVTGTPTDSLHVNPTVNTTWNGNAKRYHYPYEVIIQNAIPEGYQDPELVRPQLRTNPGRRHVNGGGWVDDRSRVDESVYVGPRAIVGGSCTITGNARIEGYAYVQDVTISGNARVTDNAFVVGGSVSDDAIVRDQCFAQNCRISGNAVLGGSSQVANYNLGGTVRVFGDLVVFKEGGECNTGEYHVLTQYNRNVPLPCDMRDSTHPENVSVNRPMVFDITSVRESGNTGTSATIAPHPIVNGSMMIDWSGLGIDVDQLRISDAAGRVRATQKVDGSNTRMSIDVSHCATGVYSLQLLRMGAVVSTQMFISQR